MDCPGCPQTDNETDNTIDIKVFSSEDAILMAIVEARLRRLVKHQSRLPSKCMSDEEFWSHLRDM